MKSFARESPLRRLFGDDITAFANVVAVPKNLSSLLITSFKALLSAERSATSVETTLPIVNSALGIAVLVSIRLDHFQYS